MVFSSTIFLFVFLPAALAGYYLLDRRFKNFFLLVISLLFYAWGEPKFVFVMIGSIIVNHFFAYFIDAALTKKETGGVVRYGYLAKTLLILSVVFNLSLFFVYKYLDFAIDNINAISALLGGGALKHANIALPIGISFFTFQAMSYVFDVYRRRGGVQKNPLNTALYISFFPQLIAGPIVRYETIAKEITCRKETLDDFEYGIKRFIIGLSKKVILANSVALIADKAFDSADLAGLTVLSAWMGAVAYMLQIYFDFSGYSDMAIGLGRMFGFHFDENFEHPYVSKSISEFWRRWHISLGSWFRDYVYFPLGGSRVDSKKRLIFNLFVVWLLTGVWHGASWNFIVWGLLHFAFIAFEKLTGLTKRLNKVSAQLYRVLTLIVVLFGWVIFRAQTLGQGVEYIKCMFGMIGNAAVSFPSVIRLKENWFILFLAVIMATPLFSKIGARLPKTAVISLLRNTMYIVLLVVSISFVVSSTYNPFIYFNF